MWIEVECETSLVIKTTGTRQHFFYGLIRPGLPDERMNDKLFFNFFADFARTLLSTRSLSCSRLQLRERDFFGGERSKSGVDLFGNAVVTISSSSKPIPK